MKNLILSVALLLALASCGGNKQKTQADDTARRDNSIAKPDTATKTTEVHDTTAVYNEEYKTRHYFSTLKEKDNFSLKLSGSEFLKSKGVLEITNGKNEQIYRYEFTTIDLLMDPSSRPVSEQTTAIREILKHYFDEEHFKSPAIKGAEKFENVFVNPVASNKTAWEEIKADPKAIRFQHREGYEGQASIAYSPSKKKAILVSYSD